MKNVILGAFLAAALHLTAFASPVMAYSSKEKAVILSTYGSPALSAAGSTVAAVAASPAAVGGVSIAAGLSTHALGALKEAKSKAAKKRPARLTVDDESVTRPRRSPRSQ